MYTTNVGTVKIHQSFKTIKRSILFKQTVPKGRNEADVMWFPQRCYLCVLLIWEHTVSHIKFKKQAIQYIGGEFSWLINKCMEVQQEAGLGQGIENQYDYPL